MNQVTCFITKQKISLENAKRVDEIQPRLFKLIQQEYPDIPENAWVSKDELIRFRKRYVTSLIESELGEVDSEEKEVINAISDHKILSENVDEEILEESTFGEKTADHVASFGGSWTFILLFFIFLTLWMAINLLKNQPADPYPFIFLNLILSCLAAIQAPIIMMSQNRKSEKDRIRNEHEYKINLKAEIEIRILNEKIDHLIQRQSSRLVEIQEVQHELLEEILGKISPK